MSSSSKRQYVGIHNGPAQALARALVGVEGRPMPDFIEPALGTERAKPPTGDRWVHELKYDGYRFQAHLTQSGVRFYTRRGHNWSHKLAKLIAPLQKLRTYAAIIDGEVVVQDERGRSDFNELERELYKKEPSNRLVFFAFDLLYLDGLDLRRAKLVERKEVLELLMHTLEPDSPVQYSQHIQGDGAKLRANICAMGLEGVVSKRTDARYESGRTGAWIKTLCRQRDTFAVIGWAQKGNRFDGFYLGEPHDGSLSYAGKIDGGWTEEERERLLARIRPMRVRQPRAHIPMAKPKAQWVEPRVLIDVEYRARTGRSRLLRHPVYKGIREDLTEAKFSASATKARPRGRATKKRPTKRS